MSTSVTELKRENARLKAENKKLSRELAGAGDAAGSRRWRWRSLAVIALVIISSVLLILGNVFFWAGNTVAKTDRYVKTVTPLVQDPVIQKAVAQYATTQIYNNVDVEPILAEELPPRIAFLAPTLATQLQSQTQNVLTKVVASDKFEQVWVNTQERSHQRLVNIATKYQGDGTINLNDTYQYLSGQLKGTPLSFLADKQLPSNVGNITVIDAPWLPVAHKVVTRIDTWRIMAITLFAAATAAAIWLSQRRRRTTITLGLSYGVFMFLTLVSIRIGRQVVSGQAAAPYQEAVQHAYQIVMHQLVLQTFVLMLGGFLVALVAWISGPSRSAHQVTDRVQTLLSGHAHGALFKRENGFTRWVGAYKRILEWSAVGVIGVIMLFSRLSPQAFGLFTLLMLVCVLVVELLAAPQAKRQSR